ncbi:MAG TPA: glycosyltransferase, partial [Rhodanobacteraceae bacterium]|nr:glycosyltransferase [Rhodanobacteraceae bacterium]
MTARSIGEKPFRVCLFGTSAPSAEALASLKGASLLAHAGDWTQIPPDSTRVEAPASDDPLDVLPSFARAFPRETLILVRSDARLPTHAFERLLRAIEFDHVLGAAALDGGSLDVAADRDVDALCFAYGGRRLVDAPLHRAAVTAWHGERLAQLGHASPDHADVLAAHGLRCVVLDHLYVRSSAKPPRIAIDPRDPPPPSPFAALRERILAALPSGAKPDRAGLDARPVLLHVLHGWGGGAERWVRDFASAFDGACHLVLISRGSFARRRHGEWLELHDGALRGPPLARVALPMPIADTALADGAYRDLVAGIVRDRCIDAVVVSSLIGHSLDVLATRLPTFAVIHDHYPLWPTLHRDFGDASLRFDDAQRAQDLAALGSDAEFSNRDPKHWRTLRDATVTALRSAGATLIAPSRSALANHLRLAPELGELPQHVIAHGLAPWLSPLPLAGEGRVRALSAQSRPRLLVPGRVRRGKGAELLAAALDGLREHADLYLIGAGSDAQALFGEHNVHIVLEYKRDELPALVARIAPDAALLLPTVAETFSYTLSELRSLGVPVIATRVGALGERIRDGVDGFLIEPDAVSATARIAALLEDRTALEKVRGTLASNRESTLAEMADAYARVLQLGSRPAARYPLAFADAASLGDAARADTIARIDAGARKLRDELAETRAESDRRGEWGHALDRELGERTRWAQSLDTELRDLRPQYEQVIGSTSWRITAPLRRWNARLAGVRAAFAFRTQHLRSTLSRVRGSLAQRGIAGTLARIVAELRGKGPARARITYAAPRDDFAHFAVPTSATPHVSIVIPVYDKVAYTSACLRSLAEHAGAIPFEVIVVDDCSNDRTQERLADVEGIRVLRNAENLGFIGSCNAGAAAARGELVLFLNNDTRVTAGWLEALVRCLDEAPDAGLVGAKLIYPDGRLQEAGGIVFDDASGWNYGRFDDPDDPRYAFRREADYCSGAAILLRTDLFRRLGGFDTRYAPAYYEDTDLAFAVRAAGYKVWYEPASTVV